jgi:hypothetical protein
MALRTAISSWLRPAFSALTPETIKTEPIIKPRATLTPMGVLLAWQSSFLQNNLFYKTVQLSCDIESLNVVTSHPMVPDDLEGHHVAFQNPSDNSISALFLERSLLLVLEHFLPTF